ncbi:hypothetical protein F2Q70_00022235 [Brassica cretica]|uniref:Uncharacterized protein n=1 Tax=Brassica cretica TaxID=69181 RepID=A0A8S9GI50_BRACR|nr:hypothetical protein F2Q70_00022235 [Brassica cretica]
MAAHTMHMEEYGEDYEKKRAIEKERFLTRKIDFSIIPLGKISRHRSTQTFQHQLTFSFISQAAFEHRPTSPTIHRLTLASTMPETEITQLADPDGYAKAIDRRTLHVSREDIIDILQTANGADNLFVQQQNIPEHQQKITREFYDTTGGIDKCFKQKYRHPNRPRFYYEEKDEYGIYRDDQGFTRDIDGHTIRVHNNDIRRLLERASRDAPNYICRPEHARSFTQTKLVPEIYTKYEINEMFYGVFKKPQTSSRRINDHRIIAACHCGAEYETVYSASIETHTATSIDNAHKKSTDAARKESVDSSEGEWENNYYNPTMAAHTMHMEEYGEDYEEKGAIEKERFLTRKIDFSIIPLGKRSRHRSTQTFQHQLTFSFISQAAFEHRPTSPTIHRLTLASTMPETEITQLAVGQMITITRSTHHPIDRASHPSIDIYPSTSIDIDHTTSIDIRPKPKTTISEKPKFDNQYPTPDKFGIFKDPDGYAKAIDRRTLHVSREDITDILQTTNGADNLFVQQQNIPEHQQKITKEFYDTTGGIDKCFKQKYRHPNRPSIDVDVLTSVERRP